MSLKKNLFVIFLAVLFFSLDVSAVTVDFYQDCESGSSGEVLTSTIMDASSHGTGVWSAPNGTMWVSENNSRLLPGVVTVDGVDYTDTGNKTWVVNDNRERNYVKVNISGNHPNITVSCYLTPGPTYYVYNGHDLIVISNVYFGVLTLIKPNTGLPSLGTHSCREGYSPSTQSAERISVVPGKTYWVSMNYNGYENTNSLMVFDPDTWEQVGVTVSCYAAYLSQNDWLYITFGRFDAHGNNLNLTSQTSYDNIMIDYTNGTFPLLPDIISDTTPPDNIAAINDGTGNDIDSTVSTTQLSANWSQSSDGESGISRYDYCIGTSQGSACVF